MQGFSLTLLVLVGTLAVSRASLFSWSSWSSCNANCGNAGQQSRLRCKPVCAVTLCLTKDLCAEEELRACNVGCPYGGTPDGFRCDCPPGQTGTCCETTLTCPPPAAFDNGIISGDDDTYGSTITYTCFDHYELVGNSQRTCNGYSWSGTAPYCEFVCPCQHGGNCTSMDNDFTCDCPDTYEGVDCDNAVVCNPPPSIAYGTYQPPPNVQRTYYIYGSTVYYQCDKYYEMIGSPTTNCAQYDNDTMGDWSNPAPTCQFECPCINNGTCSSMDSNFVCDCPMSWAGQYCQDEIICTPPPNITYGGYFPGPNPEGVYAYDATINYYCESGYQLEGNLTRTCMHDHENYDVGNWTGTQPSCDYVCPCRNDGQCIPFNPNYVCYCAPGWSGDLCRIGIQCNPPPAIPFGGYSPPPDPDTGTYTHLTTIHYTCDTNYVVTGNIESTCHVDNSNPATGTGVWCGDEATCVFVCPCENGGTCDVMNNNYQCSCVSGFKGDLCESIVTCDPPAAPSDGSYSPGPNAPVRYIPPETPNAPLRYMVPTTNYTTPAPHTTPAPTTTTRGPDVVYAYGSVITYSCAQYYQLIGNPSRTCGLSSSDTSVGAWTNGDPSCVFVCPCMNDGACSTSDSSFVCQCQPGWTGAMCESLIYCQPPDSVPNGSYQPGPNMISGNYTFNSMVTFTCDTNYVLSGEENRQCQSSGTWSGSDPTCTFKCPCTNGGTCSVPDSKYTCNCLSGTYGSSCQGETSCFPPPAVTNGYALPAPNANGNYTYQSTIQYFCNSNYGIQGTAQHTCLQDGAGSSSGVWSDTSPSCICVTSCSGMADGDYQSCLGCEYYVVCSKGTLTQYMCNGGEVWDDNKKACSATSATCPP